MSLKLELANALEQARGIRAAAWPAGGWRAANELLGGLRLCIARRYPDTYGLGNEETIRYLRAGAE